jgi:hypothetical protein
MHRFRKLLREGSWVVLGSTLLVSGMVFLIRDSINWGVVLNGTGDAIPTTAPQESNRISIASCSIVLPDRWNGTTHVVDETGYANMVAWPDSVLPKKHGAGLRVEVSPARPQGFNAATERKFLGYIAHETVSYRDGGGYETPPHFSYTLMLEVDSTWYTLSYWNHAEMSELPQSVLDHLATFRLHSASPRHNNPVHPSPRAAAL